MIDADKNFTMGNLDKLDIGELLEICMQRGLMDDLLDIENEIKLIILDDQEEQEERFSDFEVAD